MRRKKTNAPFVPFESKMKPASITFKTTFEIKKALEKLSTEGYRSLSAQIEMIVTKYLDEHGIDYGKSKKENP
jgi:hypothetical protein